MATDSAKRRALILGGGGVTGIAWELGIIAGLHKRGVDLRGTDLVVGTSAGSVVGAQITSGVDLETLFNAQLVPPEQTGERSAAFDPAAMLAMLQRAMAEGASDSQAVRARIGAIARSASSISEDERRAIIASRLPSQEWPQAPALRITAVDAESGEPRVFDRTSGVPLVAAVAASCAVPGVWPPVTIEGHQYMDGGMRSVTNADLARGYAQVVILSPAGMVIPPPFGNPSDEVAQLEHEGSAVRGIIPDTASWQAIGTNVLDVARRAPSAIAGRAQGLALADTLHAFWSGE